MIINCFLPCRSGSQRLPNKNIRAIAGFQYGLIEIKLRQLSEVRTINSIVLSTDDPEIIRFAASLNIAKLIIHKRADCLATNQTSTDNLIMHASELIKQGHILWTHVTSPFLTAGTYQEIIKKYFAVVKEGYDSLMTTTLLKNFVWDDNGPVNYDRNIEKWPRTQTLKPLYEVNSAVFIASAKIYNQMQDRIGIKPYFYPLDKIRGTDIDWPEDFKVAEALLNSKIANV